MLLLGWGEGYNLIYVSFEVTFFLKGLTLEIIEVKLFKIIFSVHIERLDIICFSSDSLKITTSA